MRHYLLQRKIIQVGCHGDALHLGFVD